MLRAVTRGRGEQQVLSGGRPSWSRPARAGVRLNDGLRSRTFLLLSITVILSALAVGTVHVPVLLAVSLVALIGCIRLLRRDQKAEVAAPALVLFALAAYSLVQAVPMPAAWLRVLSPGAAGIWAHSLSPFGQAGPDWVSISLDPGASVVEALKWTVYGGVFISASNVARRHGAVAGALLLVASATLVAIVTIAHQIVGATRLYGIYSPSFRTAPWGMGPLLNPNNLAGYLNLGFYAGLGLMVLRKPPVPRWALGASLALLVGLNVVSASRGGVAAMMLGLPALLVALARDARRRSGNRTVALRPMLAAVAAGSVLAFLGSNGETWRALRDTNTEKLANLKLLLPLIAKFSWFGVGRGAFESVSPAFRAPGNILVQYPENILVQWVAEWGVPVAVAGVVGLWLVLRSGKAREPRPVALAVAVGIGVLLVQNLVDLGLEVPSVAIAASLAVGTSWGARGSDSSSRRRPWWRAAVGLLVAASIALMGLVASFGMHPGQRDRTALGEMFRAANLHSAEARARFEQSLHDMIRRHPADPYYPLIGAIVAARMDQDPLPWANRALERQPTNARAHLVVGYFLARRGAKAQSLFELRLAGTYDQDLTDVVARIIVSEATSMQDLDRGVPDGPDGARMLTAIAARVSGAAKLVLLNTAVQRDPAYIPGRKARAGAVLAELAGLGDACGGAARQTCVQQVQADATFLSAEDKLSKSALQVWARLAAVQGDITGALRELESGCGADASCLRTLTDISFKQSSADRFTQAASRYAAAACGEPRRCAAAHAWVGDLFAARGDWLSAVGEFAAAAHAVPSPMLWYKLGKAAARAGHPTQASLALQRAEQGASPALKSLISQERQAVERTLVK